MTWSFSDDSAVYYLLPVLWMTSCLGMIGHVEIAHFCRILISFVIRQRAPAVHTFTVKRLWTALGSAVAFVTFTITVWGSAKPAILGCLVITNQMGQQLVFIFFVVQSVKGRIDESDEL